MLTSKKQRYQIFLWIALILSLALLWRISPILTNPLLIPVDDFVRHWASGRLTITGGDPYSPAQIQLLQNQATQYLAVSPVITPNYVPPWVMLLLAVFGLSDYALSRIAWLLFNSILILISAEFLWRVYNGPSNRKWIAWIACLVFAPTISVLEKGQTTSLALLGLAGFLFFMEKRENPYLAGAFASLITVKPQLLYLFWIAILFWSIDRRNFRTLLSLAITFFLTTCLVMILDPSIINQYIQAIRNYPPTMFKTPTIGGYLRYYFFGPEQFWPQYLPLPFGLAWFLYDWSKHRRNWLWSEQIPSLLFASLLTSFYGWTYDDVVLIPAVIQAFIWIGKISRVWIRWVLLAAYFLISLANLIQHHFADDFWFLWFLPAVLLWYFWVLRQAHTTAPDVERLA